MADTESSKSERTTEYKGRKIRIRDAGEDGGRTPEARQRLIADIDGQEVEIRGEEGRFASILLPYDTYESPEALARDVIDYVPDFKR